MYIEADNMGSCQSEEDVCVTYSTAYDITQGGKKLYDYGVATRSYRCGVEADLDGSNSAFCGEFKRDQDAEISREFSSRRTSLIIMKPPITNYIYTALPERKWLGLLTKELSNSDF